VGALVAAVTLASCASTGASTAPTSPTRTTGPGLIGTYSVGTRTVSFVDRSRSTPANGSYPGAPWRRITTDFYYPAEPGTSGRGAPLDRSHGSLPLVVFGPGFGSSPRDYAALLGEWASAGLVVAEVSFPLSGEGAPGGPVISDTAHQPGDMSFVITQVAGMDGDRTSFLDGGVDMAKVAAAGHSLGAITTLGLVDNPCCYDRRVKAAVVLSGAPILVPGTFFAVKGPPMLVVHGDHDMTVNYSYGVETYQMTSPPKYLVTVIGGSHSGPYSGKAAAGLAVSRSVVDFLDAYLDGSGAALGRLQADADVPGVVHLEASPR
jgi:predicted esterase